MLKIGRLTSQDLSDCFALLAKVQQDGLAFDAQRVLAALDALPQTPDSALSERRARLRAELQAALR